MSINVNDKNLGHATAYAYYKAGGGTMTEAEFTEFMADFGTASQTAVEAAQAALASETAAQTAATTATNKASEATTAATTATTKAGEASTSASTATSAKDTAVSASQTATTKATEATTAAATAVSAKDDAVSANTAAQSAKTAAQTAQTGAETAAASVSASAAQIATNAEDISQLKSDLAQVESGVSITVQREKSDDNKQWGYVVFDFYMYDGQSITVTNNGSTKIWFQLKDAENVTIDSSLQLASGASGSITPSVMPDHASIYADTYPINVAISSVAMSNFLNGKIDTLKESTEDVTIDYLDGKICYANHSDFDTSQNKYYSNNLTPLAPVDSNVYHIAPTFVVPAGTYSYYGVDSYWSFYVYGDGTQTRLGQGKASGTVTLEQSATMYLSTRENITGYGEANLVSGNDIYNVAPNKGYFSEKIERLDGFTQIMASVNMFNSVGALGDSYTAASVKNSSGTWADHPENSWIATMCKRSGVDWFNYGHGGATTQSYLSTTEFVSVLSDSAKDLYFICFGINDNAQSLTVGTVADINDADYTQNADSFCGWYGKIIAQVKAHAPNAKIVLIKPWTSASAESVYGDAVADIANHYSIPCIDPYDDIMFYGGYLTPSINAGHPTLMGYNMMGVAMERLFSECVVNNPTYFKYATVG